MSSCTHFPIGGKPLNKKQEVVNKFKKLSLLKFLKISDNLYTFMYELTVVGYFINLDQDVFRWYMYEFILKIKESVSKFSKLFNDKEINLLNDFNKLVMIPFINRIRKLISEYNIAIKMAIIDYKNKRPADKLPCVVNIEELMDECKYLVDKKNKLTDIVKYYFPFDYNGCSCVLDANVKLIAEKWKRLKTNDKKIIDTRTWEEIVDYYNRMDNLSKLDEHEWEKSE